MAARGNIVKEKVINIIQQAFGEDYLGISDKKIYVQANDGANGIVQVAITLTCPKIPIETFNTPIVSPTSTTTELPWDPNDTPPWEEAPKTQPAVEVTNVEKENLAKLLEKLGL